MYKYFVSYNYAKENGFGFGRCELTRNKKIKSIDDIFEAEKLLKEKNEEFKTLVILNYKLLNE